MAVLTTPHLFVAMVATIQRHAFMDIAATLSAKAGIQ
jgi:hypothetical protein